MSEQRWHMPLAAANAKTRRVRHDGAPRLVASTGWHRIMNVLGHLSRPAMCVPIDLPARLPAWLAGWLAGWLAARMCTSDAFLRVSPPREWRLPAQQPSEPPGQGQG